MKENFKNSQKSSSFSKVRIIECVVSEPPHFESFRILIEGLFEAFNRLERICLVLDTYHHKFDFFLIKDVATLVRTHSGHLDVVLLWSGNDGFNQDKSHRSDLFDNVKDLYNFSKDHPAVDSVFIGCEIIRENVYVLSDLLERCQSEGLYMKFKLGLPNSGCRKQEVNHQNELSFEERYHVVEFLGGLSQHYEKDRKQKYFYRVLINSLIGDQKKIGHDMQRRIISIIVTEEYLCNINKINLLEESVNEDCKGVHLVHWSDCYFLKSALSTDVKNFVVTGIRKFGAELLVRKVQRQVFGRLRFLRRRQRICANSRLASDLPEIEDCKRVLICGWYGTETLGDKAILGGVVHALRTALGPVEFILVSLFPYVSEMTRWQMPELELARIVEPWEGLHLAGSADLVVFGGGPLMALDELADMQAIFEAARKNEVKTMIAGCGIGPLGAEWHNRSIREILQLADLRIYRDEKSQQLAENLGVNTKDDIVAEDPALTWPGLQGESSAGFGESGRSVLLLGLRDFPYAIYAAHLSESECLVAKERYEQSVLRGLEALVDQYSELIIRPLPMCTNHYGGDDRWFYRRLLRGQGKLATRLDLSLLGAELSPQEYSNAFREARVVLAMRFHSLVFALGLLVPAVAIDYTLGRGKVHALAERFGVPYQSLDELTPDFLVREIGVLLDMPLPQAPSFEPQFEMLVGQSVPPLFV